MDQDAAMALIGLNAPLLSSPTEPVHVGRAAAGRHDFPSSILALFHRGGAPSSGLTLSVILRSYSERADPYNLAMPLHKAAMKTALRVLTALTEHQNPDSSDIAELRQFAPQGADLPVDELARKLIQEELKEVKARQQAAD
jgi:hypothetical protein